MAARSGYKFEPLTTGVFSQPTLVTSEALKLLYRNHNPCDPPKYLSLKYTILCILTNIYTHSQHLCEDAWHHQNSRKCPFVVSTPLPHPRATLVSHRFVCPCTSWKWNYPIHTYLCLAFILNITWDSNICFMYYNFLLLLSETMQPFVYSFPY